MRVLNQVNKKDVPRQRSCHEVTVFIQKQNSHIQKMMNKIRYIIMNSAPDIKESIKYEIPFYSHKGLLCYINPASEKVIIGFSQGAEFANEDKFLVGRGKTIRHAIYKNAKEIKTSKLQHLIFEALIINEIKSLHPRKRRKAYTAISG